jgi:hypothetical protein
MGNGDEGVAEAGTASSGFTGVAARRGWVDYVVGGGVVEDVGAATIGAGGDSISNGREYCTPAGVTTVLHPWWVQCCTP